MQFSSLRKTYQFTKERKICSRGRNKIFCSWWMWSQIFCLFVMFFFVSLNSFLVSSCLCIEWQTRKKKKHKLFICLPLNSFALFLLLLLVLSIRCLKIWSLANVTFCCHLCIMYLKYFSESWHSTGINSNPTCSLMNVQPE